MTRHEISIADPRSPEVRRILEHHLSFAQAHVPPEDRHALDADALADPDITFYALSVDNELRAVGALKRHDEHHAEIKSMHTIETARGHGLGRAILEHLLGVARDRGFQRVSLETGSMPAFAAAHALYASAGFSDCAPFAPYTESANKRFMTIAP